MNNTDVADKNISMVASGRDELIGQAAQALASKREWKEAINFRKKHPIMSLFDAIDDWTFLQSKICFFIVPVSILLFLVSIALDCYEKNLIPCIIVLFFLIVFMAITIKTVVCFVCESERLRSGADMDSVTLQFCYRWLYRIDSDLGYDHEKNKAGDNGTQRQNHKPTCHVKRPPPAVFFLVSN